MNPNDLLQHLDLAVVFFVLVLIQRSSDLSLVPKILDYLSSNGRQFFWLTLAATLGDILVKLTDTIMGK